MSKTKQDKKANSPQSAGWDASVKPMLKPENIERISDTQIRITITECADYDIDEDEVIKITIPACVLEKSTIPVDGGSFTMYKGRYI